MFLNLDWEFESHQTMVHSCKHHDSQNIKFPYVNQYAQKPFCYNYRNQKFFY